MKEAYEFLEAINKLKIKTNNCVQLKRTSIKIKLDVTFAYRKHKNMGKLQVLMEVILSNLFIEKRQTAITFMFSSGPSKVSPFSNLRSENSLH